MASLEADPIWLRAPSHTRCLALRCQGCNAFSSATKSDSRRPLHQHYQYALHRQMYILYNKTRRSRPKCKARILETEVRLCNIECDARTEGWLTTTTLWWDKGQRQVTHSISSKHCCISKYTGHCLANMILLRKHCWKTAGHHATLSRHTLP